MELEKNLKHGQLPFLERDVRNLYYKVKREQPKSDVVDLLEYCKFAKQENRNFQYAFTVDEDGNLEHIFWCSSTCSDWYKKYGDSVVFDTTYKVNSYDMPFGIFVGLNNNGKTILFGCALLRNETTKTFRWLMKTFLLLMRHPPKTILTDQDPWLTEAIAKELPTTKHSFCIWHITAKFSGWFTAILRNKYYMWCDDFYKMYWLETIEEFEKTWPIVLTNYNLNDNKHVNGLYEIKQFWVPAYLRGNFFGGMTTTGRSESINAFIKRFLHSHTCLRQFVKQVDLAIEEIENTQSYDTMLETYRNASIRTMSPLEKQAQLVLTPFAFKKIQEEIGRASQYLVVHEMGNEFIMKYFQDHVGMNHKVFWDGKVATCSCKLFDFWGILCRHIFSVFFYKDCFEIPSVYLPSRWQREKLRDVETFIDLHVHEEATGSELIAPANVLNFGEKVIGSPPISKPKGRPKSSKRMKGGKEKQTRSCGLCKRQGHYITRCPEKGNVDMSSQPQQKK